jgi:GH43 family beta-xylosidase
MSLWAPELHKVDGFWYIYVAMDDGDNANHRMYAIKCLNPDDPLGGSWTGAVRMRTPTEDFWAIDGTVLQYGNGQLYFIWSGWPTIDAGFPQNLYIAPMSDPMTISGPRVLIREPKSPWETIGAALLEGPQILENNGRTFVVFSASGSWTADYCLGIMGIDDLKDPLVPSNWWNDVDRCVFWRNDEQSVFATGHASFTVSPDGTEPWIMYHAMQAADGGWTNRTSRTERFSWNPDGSPSFPRPNGFSVPLETPSGQ